MTENDRTKRSRRQLLTGGAAAAGVLAAASLARGAPAEAANGDNVVLGSVNQATSETAIVSSSDVVFSAAAVGTGTALEGDAVDGTGVVGSSETGTGVSGTSGSTDASAAAVFGEITSTSPGPSSAGVRGKNDGTGSEGIGVYGSHAGGGWGVYGASQSGYGVYATVAPGRSQVSHGMPLTSASLVLATIQGNVTDLYVRGVTIAAGAGGSFTIHLSKAVTTKTKVAWLVIN